jgi:hypothetical protein
MKTMVRYATVASREVCPRVVDILERWYRAA